MKIEERSSHGGTHSVRYYSRKITAMARALSTVHRGLQPQNYFPITTDTRLVGYICSRLAPWLRGTPVFPGCIFYPADRFIAGMVIRLRQLLPRFYCFYFVYLEGSCLSILTTTIRVNRIHIDTLSNCSVTNSSMRHITLRKTRD